MENYSIMEAIKDIKLSARLDKQKTRIKRSHIVLMKAVDTALYGGVMLMGTTDVVSAPITAYTDGVNKRYGLEFIEPLSDPELRALILHENLHVALKQIPRGRDMWAKNADLAGMAADFVVNDIIVNIKVKLNNEPLLQLPEGGLYDPMFHNWSHREVFDYLLKNCKKSKNPNGKSGGPPPGGTEDKSKQGGGGQYEVTINGKKYGSETLDEHDTSGTSGATPDELKDFEEKVDRALREGGLLAGRLGAKIPRVISDLLTPKVDWREALREFITASIKGADEFTWRKMNRRQLANDIYMPSSENETIGEVIIAIDTSGSIGQKQLTEFATELKSICDAACPDRVRVLWWDTRVHGQQVFDGKYEGIEKMLKPMGGGGTEVSCVPRYIAKEKLNAECLIVFTDGYVETDIKWTTTIPALWLVTQCTSFIPPNGGKKVMIEKEF